MDALSLFIIIVSVVLAILFKWILIRKIQRWMDQDLIKQLSGGDPALQGRLQQHHDELAAQGIKRSQRHERLHAYVRDIEPAQD
jgi:nitrogen fixation/metabolism regulation signal transduction histidine kinase